MYKGHMDKAKGRSDSGWEVGMGGVVGHSGVKMETAVVEQEKRIKDFNVSYKTIKILEENIGS